MNSSLNSKGLKDLKHLVNILARDAGETLRRLKERIENQSIDPLFLLDVQSTFVLGLSDLSLYSFALELDDLVEDSYTTFVRGYKVLRKNGLLINVPELGLQLGYLRDLNLSRGFSLDRRFSLLGEPLEIQVWVNRVVQLRNALHGKPVKDPLRSIGYGIDEGDRRFPVLLKTIRRLYTLYPAPIDETARLLALELSLGLDEKPLECSGGTCEKITELPDVSDFRKTVSGEIELYYLIENSKDISSPWGSLSVGSAREIVVFSRKKGKGFRLREGF